MIPDDTHLHIGSLLFEGIDQIDLTGPFEVLSRIPNSTYRIYGKTAEPVRDLKGLRLTPDAALADAPRLDVLHVPGGFGQEALMEDEEVLTWLERQASGARSVFSVCTGALLCGAAGLLRGRRATTHWASFHLLPLFGAIPVNERVVVDGAGSSLPGSRRESTARCGWRPNCVATTPHGDPASHGLCARAAFRQRNSGNRSARHPRGRAPIDARASPRSASRPRGESPPALGSMSRRSAESEPSAKPILAGNVGLLAHPLMAPRLNGWTC